MKRKLVCFLFMLAGAAVIAGAILLSHGRSEYADSSPVYTLIILSIVTIIAAAFYINAPDAPEVSGREKVFLWSLRVVGILSILVGFAFIVIMLFITRQYTDWMKNIFILMVLAAAGILGAALCLRVRPPIIVRDIAKAMFALVMSAALCFVYLNYMPKYSAEDGVNMLRSDEKLEQKDVFRHENWWVKREMQVYDITQNGKTYYDAGHVKSFGGNPFYSELYEYSCDSYGFDADGLHIAKGYILFNPVTGAYEYSREEEQDQVFSPGELPAFRWNAMYDKHGQHSAALNL